MTDYAIIKTGGKQYRVRPGDTIRVEKLDGELGDPVTFDEVLLTSTDDGGVRVGTPIVESAQVEAEITGQGRGEKLIVFKYKAKTRSRVKRGHRQAYTALLIKDISVQ
ncbi:MAG: 50S ribosomal protein L21 [Dehalococcoidia bacterium]